MMKISKKMAVIWLLMPVLTFAQDDFWYQRDFPPEEFAQRRGKVFEKIGTEAVALLQGAPTVRGFGVFRQNNEFFYLCGIEVPQVYLLLDGRSGKTAVYLPSLFPSKAGPRVARGSCREMNVGHDHRQSKSIYDVRCWCLGPYNPSGYMLSYHHLLHSGASHVFHGNLGE